MTVQRLVSLCAFITCLFVGGVTGYARMGVCFAGDQPEPQQAVVKSCCDAGADHSRGSCKYRPDGEDDSSDCSPDCITCATMPLATNGHVSHTRDLKHHGEASIDLFRAIPSILLPTPAVVPPATDAIERCPLFTPTHESVPVTVLRC